MTEDEMVGWHHRLDGHDFEQELMMQREAWRAVVHGVTKSQMRLNDLIELIELRSNTPSLGDKCQKLLQSDDFGARMSGDRDHYAILQARYPLSSFQ